MTVSNLNVFTSLSSALDSTLNSLQTGEAQLATGKRVNQPSDDPVAYAESALFATQQSAITNDQTLASTVQGRMSSTDNLLGQVSNEVQSAIVTATQGADGAVNASQMQTLAEQVQGILSEVISAANFQYAGGYVFGGNQVTTAPYSPAGVYSGDANSNSVTFSNGIKVQLTFNGQSIFGDNTTGLIGTLTSLVSALQSGNRAAVSNSLPQLQTALQQIAATRSTVGISLNSLNNISTNTGSELTALAAAQQNLTGLDVAQAAMRVQEIELQQQALVALGSAIGKMPLINVLA